MRLLWCEVLIKNTLALAEHSTLAAKRLHTSIAFVPRWLIRVSQVVPKDLAVPGQGRTQPFFKNSPHCSINELLKSRLETREQRLLQAFAPFCIGIACTSGTSALAATQTALPEPLDGSIDEVSNIKLSNETLSPSLESFGQDFSRLIPQLQAVEQNFLPSLIQDTSLQAQNPPTVPPVVPPVPPENLQPNPNQDRFLQPPTNPVPEPLRPEQPVQTPVTPEAPTQPPPTPSTPNSPTIQVQDIQVTGSTVFEADELEAIAQQYEGQTLTLEQLRQVADAITQLYLERGYITSRAILVDQEVTNGVVEIRVLEGSLQEIQIEGTRRLNPSYIRSRVKLGAGTPLNTAELEDQLRLLRADPLFENVEASLRAGTQTGQSILIVRVVEADPFEGSFGID
ncbi:MAG: ShlB/FhaC/HecB family hemolysin secretion/activation protein, partial [Microcoleus sp. SIO2G3]|nr:ShlB/FhaC/HecB family hemolysin secretion/activation protein [Microcoleus sp. SIO2G3]